MKNNILEKRVEDSFAELRDGSHHNKMLVGMYDLFCLLESIASGIEVADTRQLVEQSRQALFVKASTEIDFSPSKYGQAYIDERLGLLKRAAHWLDSALEYDSSSDSFKERVGNAAQNVMETIKMEVKLDAVLREVINV